MKTEAYIYYILLWSVVLITSCQQEWQDNGSQQLVTDQADRQSKNGSIAEDSFTGYENLSDARELFSKQDRHVWQKPQKVIQYLGTLENKVVADIGAGPIGYFSFLIAPRAKKVIAIDIEPRAIQYMDSLNQTRPESERGNFETRLVEPDDPQLTPGEADAVMIVNTLPYIDDRVTYLKNLRKGISKGGRLLIVDFKKKKLPTGFPPQEDKIALYVVEQYLIEAGYRLTISDDKSLDFQYIVLAENP